MLTIALIRRGLLSLALIAGLAFTPAATPPVAQSGDNSRYAAIVVDAETGEVLFARNADARRYPASITKLMTLYLAFESLSKGDVKLTDTLTISIRAASEPPSKLGLAAGQTISLDNAMRATAVRSANDMAMAIAEHVGGSNDRFAARMTQKARELGMTQTVYVNPNGLPDSRQITSARDLSILARAIMRDYPQYYAYLGQHDWAYNGRDYRNTNGLLHTGNGYDGLKTGYINASGFNLAASAVRGDKRLITIVLGGRSTASRNAHVAALMDTGFELERARSRGQNIQVTQAFFEQRGFGLSSSPAGEVQFASITSSGAAVPSNEANGDEGTAYAALASTPAPRPEPRTPARAATRSGQLPADLPADVTAILNGGRSPAATTARTPAPRATPARASGGWAVQVGAFRDETVARNWLTEVQRRFRTQFSSAERTVVDAEGWFRSRFTGMTEQSAQAACEALAARSVTCMVVRPQG
ncbi:serine hydrolase [Brevundimonas sp.]|uniref:serine hydrolase n=1 Tax=Brevundimonas sp. TaxID=1871086 RepID=UPI0025C13E75|nr:serine hydrolase [Brevundimonas sp.]